MMTRPRFTLPLVVSLAIGAPMVAGTTGCAPTPGMSPADVRPHMWKERVLLVFSPAANDPRLAQQRTAMAADARGVAERKLVIYEIVGADAATTGGQSLGAEAAADFRARYQAPVADFEVVLIGLDGFVKKRSVEVVSNDQLFELIDAMPMRQAELGTTPGAARP